MRFNVEIRNGKIEIQDRKLEKLNGQTVEVIVISYDSPEYWQHKYYRGYLLPAIAEAMGEQNTSVVHLFLKAKYLLEPIDNIDEIPKKQLRRGIYACTLDDIISMRLKLTEYITGAILVSDREGNLCGIIPSLALIDAEKMNNFLFSCEKCLTEIGGSLKSEALEVREKWLS